MKLRMNILKRHVLLLGISFLVSGPLFAVSAAKTPEWLLLQNPMIQRSKVQAPLRLENQQSTGSLTSKIQSASISVSDALREGLNRSYFNLDNSIVSLDQKHTPLNLSQKRAKIDKYQVTVAGLPLCHNLELSASTSKNLTGTTILGRLPNIQSNYIPEIITESELAETAKNSIEIYLYNFDNQQSIEHVGSQNCWVVNSHGQIEQHINIETSVNNLPYQFTVSAFGEVVEANQKFFDVDAQITSYLRGPQYLGGQLITNTVEVDGSGFLQNDLFRTDVDEEEATKAQANDNVFNFDPNTEKDQFKESNIFQHINEHYTFLKALGYRLSTNAPIKIEIEEESGTTNNAYYLSTTPPTIFIGNGDGSALRDLALDEDVVSHELGHHVVFASITSINGESLSLHEGLADFFAMAKTSNPFLGESVCPPGSTSCWSTNDSLDTSFDYLRTASNSLSVDDIELDGHHRGQVISGLLWDLMIQHEVPEADVSALALKSIDYMVAESGFRDFLLSLFLADQNDFNSLYVQEICAEADQRGMSSYIEDLDCASGNPLANIPLPEASSGLTTGTVNNSRSSSGAAKACGVVSATSSASPVPTVLLILFPLLAVSLLRKKQTLSA